MDRCAAAYAYHKQGYNCAQSVAGAFADLTGTAPEQLMAAMGGFGGAVKNISIGIASAMRSCAAPSAAACWC